MDQNQYGYVKKSVQEMLGIDLNAYKERQMIRRLDAWLVRSGISDWESYFKKVKEQEEEKSKFRTYITINVSSFYRDNDRWDYLQSHILPDLLAYGEAHRGIKLWSAGCSIGAEPYTLSMMLNEMAPNGKWQILATDVDQGALKIAREGGPYTEENVKNLSDAQKRTYLRGEKNKYYLNIQELKNIKFKEQNLLSDPFESNFDLIICRNVIIYFTNETKDVLYRKFYDALRPGGILFLGGTEFIPRPHEIGFRNIGSSLYAKGE